MKKTIFIICILLITSSINAQGNNDLVPLNPDLSNNLCSRIVSKNGREPIEKIIRDMLIETKLISKDAAKLDVGDFINKNFNSLRCKGDPNDMHINEEHLYERAFDARLYKFFFDIVLDEDYKVDINKVIKHNGKEYTLLDLINNLIKNEAHRFDLPRLKDLRDGIEEAIEEN